MIEDYKFGSIKINGIFYEHDVIVYKDEVQEWWRDEGHNVAVEDLEKVPEGIEVFIMGNGHSSRCAFPDETKKFLETKGVEVIIQKTGEAYKTYNKLVKEGKNVAAGFHLTC
ncbi:Mth938-like domain-containing protein [Patescibacteria group bacterium]